MSQTGMKILIFAAASSLLLASSTVLAQDAADSNADNSGVSLNVSLDSNVNGPVTAGDRPTHGKFNLHFAAGVTRELKDELKDNDLGGFGGQGLVGFDIVIAEPLAFSVLGGFNPFTDTQIRDGLRSVFVGAGFRLRLFADKHGALFDNGTAAGNLWLDAHIDYVTHIYEDHGGYNIGLGYEFALFKNVNMGPYVRFQHVPWGEGQHYMIFSGGLAVSLSGDFKPSDTDGDGINDDLDQCINDPEDKDGFEDEDGCPEEDNDGDGILDADDKCPNVAGVAQNNGCPDNDLDSDGILNDDDKCPEEAEDKDNFEDEDGCPDPDNDQDGVLDPNDKCPTEAEDKDGFEDEDGCPDPDNDGDGILDVDDECPNEAETKNGKDDEDGCPDLVRVVGDQIKILEKVYFATGKAKILKKSNELLEQVAGVIKSKPDMKVRVEGHTDDVGKDAKNMKLSQKRADSVKDFLIKEGVLEAALVAEGKGETTPIADNSTKEGKAQNRRVEFHIIAKPKPAIAETEAVEKTEAAEKTEAVEKADTAEKPDTAKKTDAVEKTSSNTQEALSSEAPPAKK